MGKVVFSAYSEKDKSGYYKPITSSNKPQEISQSDKYTQLLYLPSGVVISGTDISIHSAADVSSAILPGDSTPTRISGTFCNAQNVVVSGGGKMTVANGAVASGTIIKGKNNYGGSIEYVTYNYTFDQNLNQIFPGIKASSIDAQVSSGGTQYIKGGASFNTVIYAGGSQFVTSGTDTKPDPDNKFGTISTSASGSAYATVIHQSGSMTVARGGAAFNTEVNGGTMTVSGTASDTVVGANGRMTVKNGGSAVNINLDENASLTAESNSVLAGIIYIANSESLTIRNNVNTDDLTLCFNYSGSYSSDFILTENIYKNLSDETSYSIYCSNFTEDNTFNVISIGSEFDKSISISNGNILVLDTEVYDNFGNSYVLRYDGNSQTYSVEFDNKIQSEDFYFKAGSNRVKSDPKEPFFLNTTDFTALYGCEIEIYSKEEAIPLTQKHINDVLTSLTGTLTVKKGSQTVATFTLADGIFYGQRILLENIKENEIQYVFDFKTDKTFEYDFDIRAAVSSVVLNNTDSNDDRWQSLSDDYILSGKSLSVKNEYVGYGDMIDYRRIDFNADGFMNINIEVKALTGSAEPITVSVYKTILDGSYSQLMLTFSQPVEEGLISLNNIAVTDGSYYIEVKSANQTGAINYELNIQNKLFDQATSSDKDDSGAKSKHYFADKALKANSENAEFTEWVGIGDSIDYRFIDLECSGRYSFTITKNIAENVTDNSILSVSVIKVGGGYEQVIANTYLMQNQTTAYFKDILMAYEPGFEYYISVSDIITGSQADYSVKIENSELFEAANPNDNSFETAAEYTGTVGGGNYLTENNYLGYGDTVDYIKFTVSDVGKYSITLENDLAYGASAILYKESQYGPAYAISTGVTYMPKDGKFQAISAEVELFAGTYYLQVSGGNNYNANGNTTYSVKLTGGAYQSLTDVNGSFNANTVYTLNVKENSNVIIDSSLYNYFYVYTEGPYGQQYVPFNEYTVFEAGKTYYFMSCYSRKSSSGVTITPAGADPLKAGNSITADANTSDTVDYQLLDVTGVGKYTLTLNKTETDKIFYVELLEYVNGYMITLNSAYSSGNTIEFSTNLIPNANSTYYARVTCYNPQSNHNTDYTLSFNTELNEKADRSDDTPADAAAVTIGNDGYIIKNNYLGYGDTVDYVKFDINTAGKYTVTVESSLQYGANATLYRLNDNGTVSAANLAYVTSTGAAYMKNNSIYTATSFEAELLAGTYYLQVSGGSIYNNSMDTTYSVKIDNTQKYEDLLKVDYSLYANTVYTLNVAEKSNITLSDNSYHQFMVYTDNGANGRTYVNFNEFTVFSPGETYYFVAYTPINSSKISVNTLTAMNEGETVKDKVNKANPVDYQLLNITECGEYTLSFDKIIEEGKVNTCQVSIELLKENNGIIQVLGSAYIFNNSTSCEIKNICLDPTDGSSYYFRVTNINSYSGYYTDYQVTLNGTHFAADASNNSFDTAKSITVNDLNNITVAKQDYLGFGDTTDYFTFELAQDGRYSINLSSELQYGASAVLYYYNETYNYMQYITATSVTYNEDKYAENEKFYFRTDMTNLSAGKYYIVVNGGSAYNASLNTTYSLDIVNINARNLTGSPEKFDANEYAVLSLNGSGDIYYAEISGSQYTLYYEGTYGLTAVYPYNGRVLLDPSQKYYVRSNAADNYLNFTAEAIVNKADNVYDSGTENHFESKNNWIGLNDASDSWEFDTFASDTADGGSRWEVFTVSNITDTIGASTLFNITLYKEVNGSWAWAGASYAYYNAYTDTETAGKLSVNLEADTKYKVVVSTSDNGAGNCAGYFDFSRDVYEYDLSNNTFQSATVLENSKTGTVTLAGDNTDIYEINASGSFELALDTAANNSAAVQISFYDENYNRIYLPGSGYSIALNMYNNTFAFDFANGGEDIKFAKVEAAGASVNSYTITQKA